jgi:hypothetical protein
MLEPIIPSFQYSNAFLSSVLHLRQKKFGACRGALLRARREFGVKGYHALFLGVGNFRHFRHFEF